MRRLLLCALVCAFAAYGQSVTTIPNSDGATFRAAVNANFSTLQTNKAGLGSCAAGTFGIQNTASGIVCIAVDWSLLTGIPALARTDQGNTWGSGVQDFSGSTHLRIPNTASYTPTALGHFGFDTSSNAYKGYAGGVVKTFAFLDSNITGTATNVSGTVAAANGGTGLVSYTVGDLIYATGATTLGKLAGVATGNVLLSGGVATALNYGKVGLTTHVTGILPVANGGTGVANTATLTLGTSPQNWGTLGSGIVKNTTTTGALSIASGTDIVSLFASGSCSGYLKSDLTCDTPGGGPGGSTYYAGAGILIDGLNNVSVDASTIPALGNANVFSTTNTFQGQTNISGAAAELNAAGAAHTSPVKLVSADLTACTPYAEMWFNQTATKLRYCNSSGNGGVDVGGTGGGATIASTTNLIVGDGAGNGSSSGIAPANVVQRQTSGDVSLGAKAATITLANASSTGTTVKKLVKLTGAPSTGVIAATTDTGGIVGVCVSGCGTTSNAEIARTGIVTCAFDAATTAGHYATISSSVDGDCHDAGATYPTSGQILGFVTQTNASAGDATMLIRPDTQAPVITRDIGVLFDAGEGQVLSGTITRCGHIDYSGTILASTITANVSGSASVDVKTVAYGSYTGPASTSSIVAAAPPALSSAIKSQDSTLTGWTTSLAANTEVCYVLTGAASAQWVNVALKVLVQ